jgi:hypothetical protein
MLKFVKEQTEEICLEAVKQNGSSLQYVKEHLINEEMYLEVVEQAERALKFVNKLSEEIKSHNICK